MESLLASRSRERLKSQEVHTHALSPFLHPPLSTSVLSSSKLKGSHFEYRKMLNGSVTYVAPHTTTAKRIIGFIKLIKDPKGENITSQNILFRGQQLLYTDWCVALVLYISTDCKYFRRLRRQPRHIISDLFQSSKPLTYSVEAKTEMFFVFSLLVVTLFACVSTIIDCFQPFSDIPLAYPEEEALTLAICNPLQLPPPSHPLPSTQHTSSPTWCTSQSSSTR